MPAGPVTRFTLSAPRGAAAVSPPVVGAISALTVRAPAGTVDGVAVDRSGNVLTIVVVNPVINSQPGVLTVSISNGTPMTPVYLFVDGAITPYASTVLDDAGATRVAVPINRMVSGTHTIKVSGTGTPDPTTAANSGSFDVLTGAMVVVPLPPPQIPPMPPAPPELPVNYWVFQAYDFSDLASVDTYTFEINPDKADQSFGEYAINSEPTTVNTGLVVSWEGAPVPNQWHWSGRVLNKEQYDAIVAWGLTGQRVWVTDHFHRRYLLKIASLSMTRVKDIDRQWHHKYEVTAWCLAGDGVAL